MTASTLAGPGNRLRARLAAPGIVVVHDWLAAIE